MSSLRERIEGLIAKWRGEDDGVTQLAARSRRHADELAAALAAEGQGDAWLDPKSLGIPLHHESSGAQTGTGISTMSLEPVDRAIQTNAEIRRESLEHAAKCFRAMVTDGYLPHGIHAEWGIVFKKEDLLGAIDKLIDGVAAPSLHKEGPGLFDSPEPCPRCGEPLNKHQHSREEGCILKEGAGGERGKLAAWMIENSFVTGHGDTFEDLLQELTLQIKELRGASPAGRAEQVLGATSADLAGEERDRVKPK